MKPGESQRTLTIWTIAISLAALLVPIHAGLAQEDAGTRGGEDEDHRPSAVTTLLRGLQVHGFGGWGYGRSDPHPYLTGSGENDHELENTQFALNVSAEPTDHLFITTQVSYEVIQEVSSVELDYASAQWSFSDRLNLRFGRAKLPFGIYTELFDVGTVRPFFTLPLSIYGPTGFVAKAYDGVGVHGERFRSGWGLGYDVYVGALSLDLNENFEEAGVGELEERLEGDDDDEDEEVGAEDQLETDLRIVLGGRVVITTPVDGLSFGASYYAGEPKRLGELSSPDEEATFGDHTSGSVQFEYVTGPWWVRSEWGLHEEDEFDIEAGYVEIARFLGPHWQLAARFDRADVENFADEIDPRGTSLFEHEDVSIGVNYWFSPSLVVRLSYHDVDGNLFAQPRPEDLIEILLEDRLEPDTELVLFGAQFSF